MPTTPNGAPYPSPTSPNDVPGDLKRLADWSDAKLAQLPDVVDAREDAQAARDAALAAAAAAQAVGTTNDTVIAGRINTPGSATATALSNSTVETMARTPLLSSNGFLPWWSEPRAMCHQDYDLTFVGAATGSGEFPVITLDARGHAARRRIAKTLPQRDDHNGASVLVFPDRPLVAVLSAHDIESAVYAAKAPGTNGVSGDGSADSLPEATAVQTIPGGQTTTYASLFRKPGTSVTLLMTRVGGINWRWTYSTNSGTSWVAWDANALVDFTDTVASPKGYLIGYDDVANNKVHFFAYNNPAQGTPGAQNLYYFVLDWTTENFIKPSTGAVISSLRTPSSSIALATEGDLIYTTPTGKRFRLSHPTPHLDVWITEYDVTGSTITSQIVALEKTGSTTWTRRPTGISAGSPFGGVGQAPYFAGIAAPNPQPAGKKVAFVAFNDGDGHHIDKLTVTSSWAEAPTRERIADDTLPMVRLCCPVNAGSIDLLWTRVIRYGAGYPDSNADQNAFGDLVAHYRPLGEAAPPRVLPANQAPAAGFTSSGSGLTVAYTSTSTDNDGTIASYAWDFGDGATATAANPSRTYAAAGTYSVTLTVTDDKGATSSTTQSVVVTATPQASLGTSSLSSAESGNATSTSLTWAHTNESGVNYMQVFVGHNNANPDEVPSAVTYNGAAMTLVDSTITSPTSTSGRDGSVWELANPATGSAANVVVSKTTGSRLSAIGAGFKNVSGKGATNKDSSSSTRTSTTTTTTSPATSLVAVWTVIGGVGTLTPGTGGTARTSKASSTTLQVNLSTWGGGTAVAEANSVGSASLLGQIAVPLLS